MKRHKERFGWKCILSPTEVDHSKRVMVLQDFIDKWQEQPDGSAVLRVYPWTPKRAETMELFIEGLGEGFFQTVNVERVKGVEVITREY